MSLCVVIPTYNNEKTLENVILDVLSFTTDIIIVNDGSTDSTSLILEKFPQLQVIGYKQNQGKGHALKKGFELAGRMGYRYAVTLDSDGQHFARDIPRFIARVEECPDALIVGSRNLPKDRLRKGSGFANRFSNFWFRTIAGVDLPDTQSGFRLYPLSRINKMHFYTRKYEFELEVLIRAAWKGILVTWVPIDVFYPLKNERISHYRPFRDFMRISMLYTVLAIVAFLYVKPFSFLRHLNKKSIREFVRKQILHSQDSTIKITLSLMLGVFMGIIPIWGYQLISAITLAYLFRLNKVLVIIAANISIPPLIPVILYFSFLTGNYIMGAGVHSGITYPITIDFVKNNLLQYLVGSIILALAVSFFVGVSIYVLLKLVRRKRITIL